MHNVCVYYSILLNDSNNLSRIVFQGEDVFKGSEHSIDYMNYKLNDIIHTKYFFCRNIKTLNVLGMAPKIYGVFENGLAYQYYPGVTLNPDSVLDIKIWPLVAQQMARMHKVELGKEVCTYYFNIVIR